MSTDGTTSESVQKAESFVRRLIPILKASVDTNQGEQAEEGHTYPTYKVSVGSDANDRYEMYKNAFDDSDDEEEVREGYTSSLSVEDKKNKSDETYVDSLAQDETYVDSMDPLTGDSDDHAPAKTEKPPNREVVIKTANEKKRGCETTREKLTELHGRVKATHEELEAAEVEEQQKIEALETLRSRKLEKDETELSRNNEIAKKDDEITKFDMAFREKFLQSLRDISKELEAVDCHGEREFERFKGKLIESCQAHAGTQPLDSDVKIGEVDAEGATEARLNEELESLKTKAKSARDEERRELISQIHAKEDDQTCLATLRSVTADLTKAWNEYEQAEKALDDYCQQNQDQPLDENSPELQTLGQRKSETEESIAETIERVKPQLEAIKPPFDDTLYQMWDDANVFCLQCSGQPRGFTIPEPEGLDGPIQRQNEEVVKIKLEAFLKLKQKLDEVSKKYLASSQDENAKFDMSFAVDNIISAVNQLPVGAVSGRVARESDIGLQEPKVVELRGQILARCDELLKIAGKERTVETQTTRPFESDSSFQMPTAEELQAMKDRDLKELQRNMDVLKSATEVDETGPGRFLDADGLEQEYRDQEGRVQTEEQKALEQESLDRMGLGKDPSKKVHMWENRDPDIRNLDGELMDSPPGTGETIGGSVAEGSSSEGALDLQSNYGVTEGLDDGQPQESTGSEQLESNYGMLSDLEGEETTDEGAELQSNYGIPDGDEEGTPSEQEGDMLESNYGISDGIDDESTSAQDGDQLESNYGIPVGLDDGESSESSGETSESVSDIEIGNVTSSNPTLWFSNVDNKERYMIASASPGSGWQSVTQFCSVLTVMWLHHPKGSLSFNGATKKDQIKMARLLIKNWKPADQVTFAAKELGGASVDKATLQQEISKYGAKTKIWFGNNSHVLGAVVQNDGTILMYDSNNGGTSSLTTDQFIANAQRANVFVVAATSQKDSGQDQAAGGWVSATPSQADQPPSKSKFQSTGQGGQLTIEDDNMITDSTKNACKDILGIADLLCHFDANYQGSVDPAKLQEVADRAVAQCAGKVNELIETLRVETVKKQAEEKKGDKQASTEALKLVKLCVKNIQAQLGALRGRVRKQLESTGAESVQTVGTTMFRGRNGIWLDPDAFENPPIDLGSLPGALKSAGDLAKVGETVVATAETAFAKRNGLAELLKSSWEPNAANIDEALSAASEYREILDELAAAQQQIAKPGGIVNKFVATNKAALAKSSSLSAAKKALASLKNLSKDIDKPVDSDQGHLNEVIADLQNPKDKKLDFQKQVSALGDHRKTARELRSACQTLAKVLEQAGK